MSKIYLKFKNKNVFRLNIKRPRKSRKGDFDIMVDAGKRLRFEKVVAGNYFRVFLDEINSVSWHGYHEERGDGIVILPVINFKSEDGRRFPLRHWGSISLNDPIPFPVCSVYIPSDFNVEGLGESNVSRKKNLVFDVDDLINKSKKGIRADFFVFGDKVDVNSFRESESKFIFETQSVDAFNNGGELSAPEEDLKYEYFSMSGGENVLIRFATSPAGIFSSLNGTFSMVFHEPNDVMNILNRELLCVGDNGFVEHLGNMREIHEGRMNP